MTTLLLRDWRGKYNMNERDRRGDFLFQPLLLQWTEDGQSLFKQWPHELIRKKEKPAAHLTVRSHFRTGGGSLRVGRVCWC